MNRSGVVVTGSNGFLGVHLLAELQNRGVNPLRALVRADSVKTAFQKLNDVSKKHRLGLKLDTLTPIPWDLNKNQLGMDPETLNHLFDNIDTVVHCAAEVNFLSRSKQLTQINAGGTEQLLALAIKAGVPRWLQISSLAVINGFSWMDCIDVPERQILGEPTKPVGGYARSKLLAEQICLKADPMNISIHLMRVPYLHPSRKTGTANNNGYLDVMLRAILKLGSSFEQNFSYHGLPVDQCAEWIVEFGLAKANCKSVVHVISDTKMDWHGWIDAAKLNGNQIKLEPMLHWFDQLRNVAASNKSPSLLAAYAFLSLETSHERWMLTNAHRLNFEHQNLRTVVPQSGQENKLSSHYYQTVLNNLKANNMT